MRLSSRFATALFVVALPALGAAGCDNTTDTTSSLASTTTPSTLITETFSGTISKNGAATFNFAATAAGTVTATLKSISPDTAAVMGLSLGTWNGTACQAVIANDAATQFITVTGATSAAGNLCVRAYDVGKLTASQTIELTITHF